MEPYACGEIELLVRVMRTVQTPEDRDPVQDVVLRVRRQIQQGHREAN
jgi:hypothetical protein